jgi:O-antigen/teichoic acid export membrane protein
LKRSAELGALRSISGVVAVSFAAAGVAFLVNILTSRELGPAARGEVALILQVAYFATPLILLGRDRGALRKDVTRGPDLLLPIAVPLFLVIAFLGAPAFGLAVPVATVGAWVALKRSYALRHGSVTCFVLAQVLVQSCILGGTVILAVLDVRDVTFWVLPYAVPAVVVVLAELVQIVRGRVAILRQRIWLHIHLLPATLAAMLVLRLDRLMLPALSGYRELGLYVAVATATELVTWVAQPLADHRVSRGNGSVGTSQRLKALGVDAARFAPLTVAVGIAVALIILPLMGPEFSDATKLILPLSLAALALALYRQVVAWLTASERTWLTSACEVGTAMASVPLYLTAITRWGATGAAGASCAVYVFGIVVGLVLLRRDASVGGSRCGP